MNNKNKIQKWLANAKTPIARMGATQDDITRLQNILSSKGMSQSKFYHRFNYIGFDEWEMVGIENCIESFLTAINERRSEENNRHPDETPVPLLTYITGRSIEEWWETFNKEGIAWRFCTYMEQFGMNRKTTRDRFESNRFSPWEIEGMQSVYNLLLD